MERTAMAGATRRKSRKNRCIFDALLLLTTLQYEYSQPTTNSPVEVFFIELISGFGLENAVRRNISAFGFYARTVSTRK